MRTEGEKRTMSTVYLSENAHPLLLNYLKTQGYELKLVKGQGMTYPEVAAHADLYMCKLGTAASAPLFRMFYEGPEDLGYKYPENVKYNGVCMGSYFIHHLAYTAPSLLKHTEQLGLNLIQVPQGYTKCNMVILNDTAAITSDEGIYQSLCRYFQGDFQTSSENPPSSENQPIRLLLIQPGHVKLGGFPYGFLGGASGRVGDEILFNGDLSAHPDFQQIIDFISAQGLTAKYFPDYPLEDIGSIIEWSTQ